MICAQAAAEFVQTRAGRYLSHRRPVRMACAGPPHPQERHNCTSGPIASELQTARCSHAVGACDLGSSREKGGSDSTQ